MMHIEKLRELYNEAQWADLAVALKEAPLDIPTVELLYEVEHLVLKGESLKYSQIQALEHAIDRLDQQNKATPDAVLGTSSQVFRQRPNIAHALYTVNRYDQRSKITDFWQQNCQDKPLIRVFLKGEEKNRPVSLLMRWLNELEDDGIPLSYDKEEERQNRKRIRAITRPNIGAVEQKVQQLAKGKGREFMIVLLFGIHVAACSETELQHWIRIVRGDWLADKRLKQRLICVFNLYPVAKAKPSWLQMFQRKASSVKRLIKRHELLRELARAELDTDCSNHWEEEWTPITEAHLAEWAKDHYVRYPSKFTETLQQQLGGGFPYSLNKVEDHLSELLLQEFPYHTPKGY